MHIQHTYTYIPGTPFCDALYRGAARPTYNFSRCVCVCVCMKEAARAHTGHRAHRAYREHSKVHYIRHMHACTQTHTRMHTHAYEHTHTHTHTRTRTRAHTRTPLVSAEPNSGSELPCCTPAKAINQLSLSMVVIVVCVYVCVCVCFAANEHACALWDPHCGIYFICVCALLCHFLASIVVILHTCHFLASFVVILHTCHSLASFVLFWILYAHPPYLLPDYKQVSQHGMHTSIHSQYTHTCARIPAGWLHAGPCSIARSQPPDESSSSLATYKCRECVCVCVCFACEHSV